VLTIPQALRKIKGALTDRLPEALVRGLVADLDLAPRDRVLTPVVTAFLAVRQVLHGNTAASHLRHLSGWRLPAPPTAKPGGGCR
jgi:hypothetical protein